MSRNLKIRAMAIALAFTLAASSRGLAQGAPASAGGNKVGIVNIQDAIANTNEGKKELDALQQRFSPKQAELKTLSAVSNEMKELVARARAKKLNPSEYEGGSSTISNLGMYGVREFAAIINPPQATILAVGAARRQAVESEDGGVAFTSVLSVTLSCDHRVVDGALGAELIAAFRELVAQPVTMLV